MAALAKKEKTKARKIQRDVEEKSAFKKLRTITVPQGGRTDEGGREVDVTTWPAIYEGPTTFDDKVRAVKSALTNKDGKSPFGIVHASDEDFRWYVKKHELRRALEYDRIFLQMFDINDPLHLDKMRQIYPDFFKNRERIIDMIADMQKRLAYIQLTGVQSKHDIDFLIELKMSSLPKDENGWPKFLSQPVHLMNTDEAIQNMAIRSGDQVLHPTDITDMFMHPDATDGKPKRSKFGFQLGGSLLIPRYKEFWINQISPYRGVINTGRNFGKVGRPMMIGRAPRPTTGGNDNDVEVVDNMED
ncbi:MAG: hypothetical protein QW303_01435 [Nitrososphaerota archaeon]